MVCIAELMGSADEGASYSPLLTTDSQPVRNVEPLILSKRYSSPENYMLRKITNSPFQDYTPPRKITESESFSGLLIPLSLSHTHGATANLLYIMIMFESDQGCYSWLSWIMGSGVDTNCP